MRAFISVRGGHESFFFLCDEAIVPFSREILYKSAFILVLPVFLFLRFFFFFVSIRCTCWMAEVLLCPKHWDLKLQKIRTEVCVAVI